MKVVSLFVSEIYSEYGDVFYQTEVWWLSRETFSCMLEMEMSTNEKIKAVAELADRKWLRNLALLCDIGYHFKDWNTKFKGQQKPIQGQTT
jgi:hypothetical protein